MKMMNQVLFVLFLLMGVGLLNAGCSRIQPRLYQEACERPYVVLGIAEVSVKAPRKILRGDKASIKAEKRAAKLQKKLNKALVKRAKKLYHADAVSKVEYWPALNALDFGQKEVFARAEMIRYQAFPEPVKADEPIVQPA